MGTMTTASYRDVLASAIKDAKFENWSRTFSCNPEYLFTPKDEHEVCQILEFSRQQKKNVRVVGCGHSPSDIACSSQVMISLHKEQCTVKAEAGITLKELNEVHLACHGLAITSLGAISDITLGGAISTGTHGSGEKYGTISSQVVELELITSCGKRLCCSQSENTETFLAAACGLGAMGVITTVTLLVEPSYNLLERHYPCNLDEVLANLDAHLKSCDHFRCLWYPYTNGTVCFHLSRTTKEKTKTSFCQRAYKWVVESAFGYYGMELLYYLSTWMPGCVPFLNGLFFRVIFAPCGERVDVSYRVFNYECRFKQRVNEWAIPKASAALAIWKLREWIENTSGIYAHIPIEIRFARSDNLLMSPAYGRDTCYMNIIMYRPYGKDVPYKEYWAAYEEIMKELGGRPHWAKAHKVTGKEFAVMYPGFKQWCQIRRQLDPLNMFVNSYLQRVLTR
ncbi:L-gulonolactone oxidase-like isoform X2 [Ornithodoros turicata]|uniref:L-gulonolactone oxidase-like isoform X2 n=1 Tax=Ornithodoros turicata TaxID=34597 RepID=UPI003139DE89